MPEFAKKNIEIDERTGAASGLLTYGNAKVPLPNKFATTSELNATKVVGLKQDFPTEFIIAGKLIFPETLKRILREEEFLKEFARRLARETSRLTPPSYRSTKPGHVSSSPAWNPSAWSRA